MQRHLKVTKLGANWGCMEGRRRDIKVCRGSVGTGLKSDAEALRGNGGALKGDEKVLNCDRELLTVHGA